MKLAKYKEKERILKADKDKRSLTYKGRHIRLAADLSTEIWQARREWQEIFNVLNENNMRPRILYPERLPFRIGERKSFPDQQKLKEFLTTKLILQENFKGDSLSGGGKKKDQSNKDCKGPENTTRNTNSTVNTMALNSYLSIITQMY